MSSLTGSKEYLLKVYSAVYSNVTDDLFIVTQLPDTAYEDRFTDLIKFSQQPAALNYPGN